MAGELPDYISWIKRQPCAARFHGDCQNGVEAHHARHRTSSTSNRKPGLGQKAHDDTAVPLCTLHHRRFHDGGAPFVAMGRQGCGEWMDKVALKMRTLYASGAGIVF